MPTIRPAGAEARSRLTRAGASKGYQERAPYREAIAGLSGDQVIEIEPDEGETLRQVRMRVARASKEASIPVKSGETQEGTLLVWLAQPVAPTRRRRRRRRTTKQDVEPEALASPTPQDEMPPQGFVPLS